ncbi:MAG: hypothetical protein E7C63_02350 [Finegoldia magna]|uniref:hypothetical protein n=1 Tax=Finegoldia magna TaxID=1260 RepID=UPI0028FEC879|nr:hypothetical protein [Finegoldia magna]MDU2639085.1 hypothetical protein [Finegoldia magna]
MIFKYDPMDKIQRKSNLVTGERNYKLPKESKEEIREIFDTLCIKYSNTAYSNKTKDHSFEMVPVNIKDSWYGNNNLSFRNYEQRFMSISSEKELEAFIKDAHDLLGKLEYEFSKLKSLEDEEDDNYEDDDENEEEIYYEQERLISIYEDWRCL